MSAELPELAEYSSGEDRFIVMQEIPCTPSRAPNYRPCSRSFHSYQDAVDWAEWCKVESPKRKGEYIIISIRSGQKGL